MTKTELRNIIINELSAGLMNLELEDSIIDSNIDRALSISSDYFSYVSYKTMQITKTTSSGGYILLTTSTPGEECVDPDGIPVITAVIPTQQVVNADAALLGLGSMFLTGLTRLGPQVNAYANTMSRLSQLESILGRGAKVVGDKLFLDKHYEKVTVAYIPQVMKIENIHEGSWINWIIEYALALSKRQLAQSRGKYVVSSNPSTINAAQLLEEANAAMATLKEDLENKGHLRVSR